MENQQVSSNLIKLPIGDGYFVNDFGQILSNRRGKMKILTHWLHYGKSKNPYYRVKLNNKATLVHRAIATIFVGRELKKDEYVNHINGITLDNRLDNLEIVSHYENVAHAVANKLYCHGEAWHLARKQFKERETSTTIPNGSRTKQSEAGSISNWNGDIV